MYYLLGDPGYAGPQGLRGEIGQKGGHFVVLKNDPITKVIPILFRRYWRSW